jgi:hypothetical protein
MAVVGIKGEEEMRRVLLSEGVFRGAGTADAALLEMYWRARDSDEYQQRLRAIEGR